jgi:hypothetical protein
VQFLSIEIDEFVVVLVPSKRQVFAFIKVTNALQVSSLRFLHHHYRTLLSPLSSPQRRALLRRSSSS